MFYKNAMTKNPMTFKEIKPKEFDGTCDYYKKEPSKNFGDCEMLYNFSSSNGVLKDCFGITNLKVYYDSTYYLNQNQKEITTSLFTFARRAFFHRYFDLNTKNYTSLLIVNEGYDTQESVQALFINRQNNYIKPTNQTFNYDVKEFMVTIIKGLEYFVMLFADGKNYVWNPVESDVTVVNSSNVINSMCWYDNRAFATCEKGKPIIYSDEFNPSTFSIDNDKSGFINVYDELGKCNKIFAFKDAMYVFRDYGITKITCGKGKHDFNVDNVYICNVKIYPKSITYCGDQILFLAYDGVYSFDGKNVTKIKTGYEDMFTGQLQRFSTGAYSNGIFYLLLRVNFNDGKTVDKEYLSDDITANSIIKYNLKTGKIDLIRGMNIVDLIPIKDANNDCLAVLYHSSSGRKFGKINESGETLNMTHTKYWKSKEYDFGSPDKYKFIKEIKLTSKSDVSFKLVLDGKETTIKITGSDKPQVLKINKKAKKLAFGFETVKGGNYITTPIFTVGFYNDIR